MSWKPPTPTRVGLMVHPDVVEALHDLLSSHPQFRESGIGYSEFIMRCVIEARNAADENEALGVPPLKAEQ